MVDYNSRSQSHTGTCYTSQTRDQQRFTISEVAADWLEPMVSQRIMWSSIARANGQLDPRAASRHTIAAISHTRPSPLAVATTHFRPAEGRRLSWPEHTVG